MNWKWILAIVLFVILVILTIQNVEVVEIRLLFWTIRISRVLMIFFTLLTGFIIGWTACIIRKERKKKAKPAEGTEAKKD